MKIVTARERLLTEYSQRAQDKGVKWYYHTRPYHSTHTLMATVVAAEAAGDIAFAVFEQGQEFDFFNYGIGEKGVLLGMPATRRATTADTNLVKAKSTNGATDYCIEGVGFGYRSSRIAYNEANADNISGAGNAVVDAALAGEYPVVDPGALVTPPQLQSPFNQEIPMWHGLAPFLSVKFQWDGGTPSYDLGTCDMFPDASAKSELRSSGRPEHQNRYVIPEGYVWRRDGVTEGEFVAKVKLEETVVVPITLPADPAQSTIDVTPSNIYVDFQCRVFGLEFRTQGQNG